MAHTPVDILVIESDPVLHALLAAALGRAGYSAEFKACGERAFTFLSQRLPRLILLDLYLAQENGLDLLKRLKSDKVLKDVDVILISALGFREIVQEAVQAGAADFIMKPFLVDELLLRVGRVLNGSTTR
jgi:DNA-binding response OmpR family regulator